MKIKIGNLSVYHKFTEIEIEIPEMDNDKVWRYLVDNEDNWVDELDSETNQSTTQFTSGQGEYDGYDDGSESETRYDVVGQSYGGHL
tara:strand:+ start:271 stop:531 length:261 start_codon:yes stop_codon:yes gene_type:complete